jgi:hypothetical protein
VDIDRIPDKHVPTAKFICRSLKNLRVNEIDWGNASDPSPTYNCLGLAVGDYQWWQPPRFVPGDNEPTNPTRNAWPESLPDNVWLKNVVDFVATYGFTMLADGPEWEEDFDKIVLIEIGAMFQHAAKLVAPGCWVSKLGSYSDIRHPLDQILGYKYGGRCHFYKRRKAVDN